jgi:mRNA-degrading endonuclease HigB of HigAB toxin-antitoxin module
MCAMKLYRSLTSERVVIDVPVDKARLILTIHYRSHPCLVDDTALTMRS